MRRKRISLHALMVLGLFGLATGNVHSESYSLTPKHGPWLIYVTFFRGPDAKREAAELVRELRESHQLTAYTHSISDQKREEERIRRARYSEEHPGFRAPGFRIRDEYAVLVGDYRSRASALRALANMKNQKSSWFSWPSLKWFRKEETKDLRSLPNPFARSFVVPNPIAPKPEKTFRIWD